MAREVFGGVGSVEGRGSVSTGGLVMIWKYRVEGEGGGEGQGGKDSPAKKQIRHDLIHGRAC